MTTSRKSNDLVVGLTILLGIALIVAATLWLQRTDVGRSRKEVVARFRDAGNIRIGNTVSIRGVDAGRVDKLVLADSGWVHVSVKLNPDVQLPPNPVMVLYQASLFGDWAATFMARDAAAAVSPDVSKQLAEASGDRSALPGVVLPDIAQLTAVAGQIAGEVSKVAERFQTAFTDSTARELSGTFTTAASLARELERAVRRQSGNLDKLSVDLLNAMTALDTTARALQRTAKRADNATASGEIDRTVRDAAEAAAAMREASVALRGIVRELAASEGGLVSTVARTDSVMARVNRGEGTLGMLSRDPALYRHTDSLVLELRALVADVKANPKKYVSLKVF
jgi:phospholipid/cholesterol/gamma-HCH transport system substrate-binding protein